MANSISCHTCQHYYVTWEPKTPHGCRLMGFKSKLLPSMVVKRDSGAPCQGYAPKPRRSPGK